MRRPLGGAAYRPRDRPVCSARSCRAVAAGLAANTFTRELSGQGVMTEKTTPSSCRLNSQGRRRRWRVSRHAAAASHRRRRRRRRVIARSSSAELFPADQEPALIVAEIYDWCEPIAFYFYQDFTARWAC